MTNEFISVAQAAESLQKRKQYIFKLVNRFGIEKTMQKSSSSHGQTEAYISVEDFELVKEYVLSTGATLESATEQNEDISYSGVFYLIQLEPEHDPGRFKLGFASSIEERLRAHRTSAPYARVLNTWP